MENLQKLVSEALKINEGSKLNKSKILELKLVEIAETIQNLSADQNKDHINPSHYRQYPMEVIEMMQKIFGKSATASYCTMTAFKYRMRLGHKDEVKQELKKESWYLNKARELQG